jgi:hypothetical protein
MTKAGIDQDAIIKMFSEATIKQGEALRKAVGNATSKALQGRELTIANIKKVLTTVTTAATMGEAMLGKAFDGMDGALLQAVEAHRKALQQFVDQGASLQEKQLKGVLSSLEKLEDTFFATVTKAVEGAGNLPMKGPWDQVLSAMKTKGSDTGAQATRTVQDLLVQTQTALLSGRASGAKAARAMLDGYSALVSGVLIGMSDGLQGGATSELTRSKSKK